MLNNYSFARKYPKDLCTRVVCHYALTDQSASKWYTLDDSVENTLGAVLDKHIYFYRTMDVVDAATEAITVLQTNAYTNAALRGSCNIGGYPAYTYSGSKYFVRAGCLVHIHHSRVSAVNNQNMIATEIRYNEPTGISEMVFLDSTKNVE